MTFEAFQSYIKENVLKGWREDADIEMAVVRKNNGIELCGLYIRREEEQISPTIYLDEYYSYYLKGEALDFHGFGYESGTSGLGYFNE